MHDGIARPDDVKWPNAGTVDFDTINDKVNNRPQRSFAFDPLIGQPIFTHRAQLAEKILLELISDYNDPLRDCTREERAEYAVREADALIAALERK